MSFWKKIGMASIVGLGVGIMGATVASLSKKIPYRYLSSSDNIFAIEGLKASFQPKDDKELLGYVLDGIKANYVEEVDSKKLMEGAMSGLLSSLDPHSSYLSEKEFKEMKIHTSGEFGGLGIVVVKDSFVKVVSSIDDTPAHKVGIKAGDYIGEIDDQPTYSMSLNEAVEKMRGKPGTKVKLSILRSGEMEPLNFVIRREIIKVDAIKGRLENKDIIYLKITNFTKNTCDDLVAMYHKLKNSLAGKKLRGLILDLRNNPGGLLDQAVKVSELFLPKDKVVVSLKGRRDRVLDVYKSTVEKVLVTGIPMVVLVNEGSASASEIVAGALQDHRVAVVMGTKTFGKASVQTIFPLANGGALKMTIARYYTPLNRSLQANGIEPDIITEEASLKFSSSFKRVREKDLAGHLAGRSNNGGTQEDIVDRSIQKAKENQKKTEKVDDYQLSKAIDLIVGLDIYGKSNNSEAL